MKQENIPVTESDSTYANLDKMDTLALLGAINAEDKTVPLSIEKVLPQVNALLEQVIAALKAGGRLFYIGAGTSGRLGIVDASECPPTYGVPHGMVIGIMAGGDSAIRKAVEFAEDDRAQGFKDLQAHNISVKDVVIGITASGKTPYVLGAMEDCNKAGIITGGISCNRNSPLGAIVKYPVEVEVGPELVTGSTRMKAGTAQKLILNMISTTAMISLGKVKGNRMVDMQLSNNKLIDRGTRMVMDETGLEYEQAKKLLLTEGSVRKAIDAYKKI